MHQLPPLLIMLIKFIRQYHEYELHQNLWQLKNIYLGFFKAKNMSIINMRKMIKEVIIVMVILMVLCGCHTETTVVPTAIRPFFGTVRRLSFRVRIEFVRSVCIRDERFVNGGVP